MISTVLQKGANDWQGTDSLWNVTDNAVIDSRVVRADLCFFPHKSSRDEFGDNFDMVVSSMWPVSWIWRVELLAWCQAWQWVPCQWASITKTLVYPRQPRGQRGTSSYCVSSGHCHDKCVSPQYTWQWAQPLPWPPCLHLWFMFISSRCPPTIIYAWELWFILKHGRM